MGLKFDLSELKGRIVSRCGDYASFAKTVGLSRAQLSERLSGKRYFKPDEIYRICDPAILDIPGDEIGRYFFTPKV